MLIITHRALFSYDSFLSGSSYSMETLENKCLFGLALLYFHSDIVQLNVEDIIDRFT